RGTAISARGFGRAEIEPRSARTVPEPRTLRRAAPHRAMTASRPAQRLQVTLATQHLHLRKNPLNPLRNVWRRAISPETSRAGKHRGERGGFVAREAARRFAEEVLRGGFHAIDAVAEFGDVQVDLEDALLRPEELDEDGEPGFDALARVARAAPEEEILGDLLRERARAARTLAVRVLAHGFADRFQVEAGVKRELLILRRDDGDRGMGRDAVEIDPCIAELKGRLV